MAIDYISVNGVFGSPAFTPPQFRTAKNLLAHMDRLGVARAITFHASARDLHPTTGNRELLSEIESTPGAAGRLLPAFTIGPCLLYENNAFESFLNEFRAAKVRALRLFPASQRYQLSHIAPILERVLEPTSSPLLLCDASETPNFDDIAQLAQRFPKAPICITQSMWPNLPTILDLLKRFENVLCDTSWIHSSGTIEMICQRFGARRLLFGLGPIAHQGAAIGALQLARISDREKQQIASGNVEALLGLTNPPPSCLNRLMDDTRKPLWRAWLKGEKLDVKILDAHGHFGPMGFWMIPHHDIADQAPRAIEDMDRCGIETLIVSGLHALFADPVAGNRSLEESLRPYGNRFRGYVVFNPLYAEQLEPCLGEFFSKPFFVGFKLLNDYWRVPVTDPRLNTVWRYANAHRLPILLHTWNGPYNSPAMLKDIVPAHPDATFVLGHAGGGDSGRKEAEEIALANRNVVLEWCGSFCSSIPWEQTLARVGAQQVVFGTDAIVHDFAWELGRLLSLDVPDDVLRPILGDNMHAVLAKRA